MKSNFSNFVRQFPIKWLLMILAVTFVAPLTVPATQSIAIFTQTSPPITVPPNVDATNFYNSGNWNINTTVPFTTANTLNYTNVGDMVGSIGWEFDWGPNIAGQRSMSASFFNAPVRGNGGIIQASDGVVLDPKDSLYSFLASKLVVSATNIINQGTLIGGSAGKIVLNGVNVNLRRSTLLVGNITPEGSSTSPTNFVPDTAIYDEDWGQTNVAFNSSTIWDGVFCQSPGFGLNGLCQSAGFGQLAFGPSWADSTNIESTLFGYTTNITYTNSAQMPISTNQPTKIFRQAVFIAVGDPNIIPDDRFFQNSDNRSNLFQTITVRLTSALAGNSVYLEDTLAALTNRGLALNTAGNIGDNPLSPCTDPTYRPANYILSRVDTGSFAFGTPGQGVPTNNFFYDPASFSSNFVAGPYAGYVAYVDDLVRHPVGVNVTNLPGRIVINATNLDLTQTTLLSAGAEIAVQANNFIGSTGAAVSCQNLSFNLGSAAGNVNVTDLVTHVSVPGMNGEVAAFSAVWTNSMVTAIFTNYDTNVPPNITLITNIAEMDFHVLMVDATGLSASVPVYVQDLMLQTNAVISDSMNVVNRFLFSGQSLTVLGTLNLSGPNLQYWTRALAPNLLYFTNNGTLSIPVDAHFGDDGPTNYAAFVNNGTINVGGSETINSAFYQSGGNENAPGGYFVTTASGKIEHAAITSGQDADFTGGFLKLDNSVLSVGNQLNFTLTNALYDSGGSANNTLVCGDGFNLWVKPSTGDLLGTTLTSQAYNGAEVDSVWAGQDRGATAAGYTNNVALGHLILSPQGTSPYPALFYFFGAGAGDALYVDLLDLSQITNLTGMLATDPNLVIYYAAAKLPSAITVLNGNGVPVLEVQTNNPLNGQTYYVVANGGSGQIPQEAEEVLNGQLGGHLQWVGSFAGPNSSVDVVINGQTYVVNRALRYSLSIDSNNNGIPNGVDPNPFNTPPAGSVPALVLSVAMTPPAQQSGKTIQSSQPSEAVPALSWLALPGTVYQVQYSTNLASATWLPLLNYTNTASTNVPVTVWDTNAVSSQRFYRVSHP